MDTKPSVGEPFAMALENCLTASSVLSPPSVLSTQPSAPAVLPPSPMWVPFPHWMSLGQILVPLPKLPGLCSRCSRPQLGQGGEATNLSCSSSRV